MANSTNDPKDQQGKDRPDQVGPPAAQRTGFVPPGQGFTPKKKPPLDGRPKGQPQNTQSKTQIVPPFTPTQESMAFVPPLVSNIKAKTINVEVWTYEASNFFAPFLLRGMQSNKANKITLQSIVQFMCLLATICLNPNYVYTDPITGTVTDYSDRIREYKALLPSYEIPKIFVWLASVTPIGFDQITISVGPVVLLFKFFLSTETLESFRNTAGSLNSMLIFTDGIQKAALESNLEVSNIANMANRHTSAFLMRPISADITKDAATKLYSSTATAHTNEGNFTMTSHIYMMLLFGYRFNIDFLNMHLFKAEFDDLDLSRVAQDAMRIYNHENSALRSRWPQGNPNTPISVVARVSNRDDDSSPFQKFPNIDFEGQTEEEIDIIKDVIQNELDSNVVFDPKSKLYKSIDFKEFIRGGFKITPKSEIFKGITIPKDF